MEKEIKPKNPLDDKQKIKASIKINKSNHSLTKVRKCLDNADIKHISALSKSFRVLQSWIGQTHYFKCLQVMKIMDLQNRKTSQIFVKMSDFCFQNKFCFLWNYNTSAQQSRRTIGNQINCPQTHFLKWLRTGIDNCDIHRLKSILHGFLKLAWKGNFREDKVDLTSIFFNFSLVVVFLTNSECHFWQGSRWIQPDSMAPDNDRYCIIWAKANAIYCRSP